MSVPRLIENLVDEDGTIWIDASTPPDDSRRVWLRFQDGTFCEGFWWRGEKLWYKSEGSKAKRNAVVPTHWQEGVTLGEYFRSAITDDGIDLMV